MSVICSPRLWANCHRSCVLPLDLTQRTFSSALAPPITCFWITFCVTLKRSPNECDSFGGDSRGVPSADPPMTSSRGHPTAESCSYQLLQIWVALLTLAGLSGGRQNSHRLKEEEQASAERQRTISADLVTAHRNDGIEWGSLLWSSAY